MDLSGLRPLYDQPGPWASAYLDASRDTEDARTQVDLRWRTLHESLADQGADQATIDAMAATLGDEPPRPGRHGLALFAAGGQVRLVEALPAPPRADLASWGPLPHVMPMVAQRGEELSWLRVVADRTGADLAG